MTASPKVAVLGAGTMAQALIPSFIAAAGPEQITLTRRDPERALQTAQRLEVGSASTNLAAVDGADVVVLGTKPKDVLALAREIAPRLKADAIVVSIAAGVNLAALASALAPSTAIVRAMPNTPALVGAGVTVLSANEHTNAVQLELVEQLFAQSGAVYLIPESQQSIVGALAGSGPAYLFYVMDALAEAGVRGGLTRAFAQDLAARTVAGAGALAVQTHKPPSQLREEVTSPGGTTVEALAALDQAAVRAAFLTAVERALQRTSELGG